MKLTLFSARRTLATSWICQSCRKTKRGYGNVRTNNVSSNNPPAASRDNEALRENGPARTRFAPSPTGYLHLGSLRTALFNYLIAKATGGQFLLRIEDTDQKRTIPDAEERLFQDLEWAGIRWDEGPKVGGSYGPYKQSQRTAIYRKYAEQLLESGNAYRCFCSPERLHALAEHRQSQGQPPDYDRTCAHIPKEQSDDRAAKGEAHIVRLKSPEHYPAYTDLVYGLVRHRTDLKSRLKNPVFPYSYDDPVLLKSDGFPTYHLANVVDDHLMEITHVIRGSEWMSSTPKHLAMYNAFGWQPPAFAHVSLLVDKNGAKLSKRTGSVDLAEWRVRGVFPETLTNFVALLGWSHRQRMDLMSMEDLIKAASMKFTRGDTHVAFEKLWFLQRRHAASYASLQDASNKSTIPPNRDLKLLAVQPILSLLTQRPKTELPVYSTLSSELARESYVCSIVVADAPNYTTPNEFIDRNIFFFGRPEPSELKAVIPSFRLHKIPPQIPDTVAIPSFLGHFSLFDDLAPRDWTVERLKACCETLIAHTVSASTKERDLHEKEKFMIKGAWTRIVHGYLRWALMAGKPGPDSSVSMHILGKQETIWRLEAARHVVEKTLMVDGQSVVDGPVVDTPDEMSVVGEKDGAEAEVVESNADSFQKV